ncbi:uncharacterized protein BDR25DRAFT_361238 [Lindgomyces ingoldianus]|uniref:Uncharacterized protein n=1 Tax=Lindgomyces ingoldianus TaxID=673940 RepID=A0ACB6QEY4_9PLEO|nr:uncharacterized protein BDR25DRAFT_361238 [Lindgomyces ingoldianus]KAF2464691.1 hypothetical protein BDR25DRAFT_361238 [Lindgomyces ingoldianus]
MSLSTLNPLQLSILAPQSQHRSLSFRIHFTLIFYFYNFNCLLVIYDARNRVVRNISHRIGIPFTTITSSFQPHEPLKHHAIVFVIIVSTILLLILIISIFIFNARVEFSREFWDYLLDCLKTAWNYINGFFKACWPCKDNNMDDDGNPLANQEANGGESGNDGELDEPLPGCLEIELEHEGHGSVQRPNHCSSPGPHDYYATPSPDSSWNDENSIECIDQDAGRSTNTHRRPQGLASAMKGRNTSSRHFHLYRGTALPGKRQIKFAATKSPPKSGRNSAAATIRQPRSATAPHNTLSDFTNTDLSFGEPDALGDSDGGVPTACYRRMSNDSGIGTIPISRLQDEVEVEPSYYPEATEFLENGGSPTESTHSAESYVYPIPGRLFEFGRLKYGKGLRASIHTPKLLIAREAMPTVPAQAVAGGALLTIISRKDSRYFEEGGGGRHLQPTEETPLLRSNRFIAAQRGDGGSQEEHTYSMAEDLCRPKHFLPRLVMDRLVDSGLSAKEISPCDQNIYHHCVIDAQMKPLEVGSRLLTRGEIFTLMEGIKAREIQPKYILFKMISNPRIPLQKQTSVNVDLRFSQQP